MISLEKSGLQRHHRCSHICAAIDHCDFRTQFVCQRESQSEGRVSLPLCVPVSDVLVPYRTDLACEMLPSSKEPVAAAIPCCYQKQYSQNSAVLPLRMHTTEVKGGSEVFKTELPLTYPNFPYCQNILLSNHSQPALPTKTHWGKGMKQSLDIAFSTYL